MFVAYVIQEGGGCDYTIGCAQTLWRLKATDKPGAIEELKRRVIGEWLPKYGQYEEGFWDEAKLGKLTLFEIAGEEEMPLAQWYQDAEEFAKDVEAQAKDAAERAEFERLKAKFGNSE